MEFSCTGNIYDFQDFAKAVESSNGGNMDVIVMENDNFRNLRSDVSQARLKAPGRPMLADVVQVKFVRGRHTLQYKTSFSAESFTEFCFLKKSFKLVNPGMMRSFPRGVSSGKKRDILTKLCPLMPLNRHVFWKNLPENDTVEDLIEHE